MRSLLLWFVCASGCYSEWKAEDVDGDGRSSLEGDCWESNVDPVPPEGAMDHGVTAKDIYEGAEDLPYDGIDANCDGKDDFDVDGDGFVPFEYAGLPTVGVADSGGLPAGDCFDSLDEIGSPEGVPEAFRSQIVGSEIHPAVTDVFYDGIDANCDGKDDFDADEDGFSPSSFAGIETQLSESAPLPSGDCFDSTTDSFADPTGALSPADVNPGAVEIWYDGADQNCDAASDCDQDGDGFEILEGFCAELDLETIDCNDLDGSVFPDPSIEEIFYNGIDENCDLTDGDGDKDGDGRWDANYPFTEAQVDVSVSYPELLDDCWDDDDNPPTNTDAINGFSALVAADVFPDAEERFYDGIDQNCDGSSDFDADGDGFATEHYPNREQVSGTDCVDAETDDEFVAGQGLSPADIYPNNLVEVYYDGNDQNCDDLSDFDKDQDGQDSSDYGGTDCNDLDSTIFFDPNLNDVDELVNDGVDQNCDGFELCYLDTDTDNYGNSAGQTGNSLDLSCVAQGFSNNTDDCDDADGTVYPSAPEICDGKFNDCANPVLPANEIDNDQDFFVECTIDFGGWDGDPSIQGGNDCNDLDPLLFPTQVWYADIDADTYGDPNNPRIACEQPTGYTLDQQDCNDADDTVYPGADEVCDGQDNDCDGELLSVESDLDGDLYVDCDFELAGITWAGDSLVLGGDDCNDQDPTVHPNANEICDGQINICGGTLPVTESDDDLDGFVECTIDSGGWDGIEIQGGEDCDDANRNAFPGAAPTDSATDCLLDADGDDYGDAAPVNAAIASGSDCDDGNDAIHPAATELENDGVDQNCDNQELCPVDGDLDTYGHPSSTGLSDELNCIDTAGGFSSVKTDCDDGDSKVHPNADEICDGQYNDCSDPAYDPNSAPEVELDGDGDKYVDCMYDPAIWVGAEDILGGEDCNDEDGTIFPSATEGENDGVDQNCDNQELCYIDDDRDAHGDVSQETGLSSSLDCLADGFSDVADDCDDTNGDAFPGAAPEDSVSACLLDADGDDYGDISPANPAIGVGTDCNDGEQRIFPTAVEEENDGVDQNCDDLELCPIDGDLDTFGHPSLAGLSTALSCIQTGFSNLKTDCDDTNGDAFPGAAPEDSTSACMLDADYDDYGDATPSNEDITPGSDCDDGNDAINSAATELENDGVDQNCDNKELCPIDGDGDSYGHPSSTGLSTALSCSQVGFSNVKTDCDDANIKAFPGAAPEDSTTACLLDADGDDYGDVSPANPAIASGTDCNDGNGAINPVATEGENDGVDQNCDNKELCPVDGDLDTYGHPSSTGLSAVLTCTDVGFSNVKTDCDDSNIKAFPGAASEDSPSACMLDADDDDYGDATPANTAITSGNDCNDGDSAINPGETEGENDGVDQNCDNKELCPVDGDLDTFGHPSSIGLSSALSCIQTGFSNVKTDCDDSDIKAFPGAAPEDSASACMLDADDDDYGDATPANSAIDEGTDCNDGNGAINPVATELENDGVDQNCDDRELCPVDGDLDTYGHPSSTNLSSALSCIQAGFSNVKTDCDDSDIKAFPGAAPEDSTSACMLDVDGDDFGDLFPANPAITSGTDCNDEDDAINPGETEGENDSVDQNCDGLELCPVDGDGDDFGHLSSTGLSLILSCTEEGFSFVKTDCDDSNGDAFPGAAPEDSFSACMLDADGDDYGDAAPANGNITSGTDCDDSSSAAFPGSSPNDSTTACMLDLDDDDYGDLAPANAAITSGTDCNDSNIAINSAATELENDGVDQNCDNRELCPVDGDLDTYGHPSSTGLSTALSCIQAGFSTVKTDCDDANSNAFPGAASIDSTTACMLDDDGDGYGDATPANLSITSGSDCNDGNGAINPGETEGENDGVDQNCDNQELCPVDIDQDGYGHLTSTGLSNTLDCTQAGFSTVKTDCDDGQVSVNPGETEIVNDGVDQNCDGQELCPVDGDLDTYGHLTSTGLSTDLTCLQTGFSNTTDDCDDDDENINPNATEVCDGIDNDCDTDIDDLDSSLDLSTQTTYYLDDDADGYGDGNSPFDACTQPSDHVLDNTDCDDGDVNVYPNAPEFDTDNVDSNCDDMESNAKVDDCYGLLTTGEDKYFLLCYAKNYTNAWTQAEAEALCQEKGYDGLASILNATENALVGSLITSTDADLSGRNPYIGLIYDSVEAAHVWSNGDVLNYTNWAASEPSNAGAGEDCVEFFNTANSWNDLSCTTDRDLVCSVTISQQ